MPEYMGYIPGRTEGINWAEKMSGLGEKVESAIGTRDRERQAYEDTRAKNEEVIDQYEAGSNQTFNDLIFNGATEIKDHMYEWNKAASRGEMTQSEYKQRMNNAMSYWSQLSKSAKTFDERSLEMLKRQQPDPETGQIAGSSFENYINMMNAKSADLANSKIYTDPNTGKIFLTKQDEEGNIVSQTDVRQSNNPGNMVDNRVNLGGAVKEGVKNFEDFSKAKRGSLGRIDTESDKRLNLAYTKSKNALIGSILSNDRSIAGVLMDNSNDKYKFYSTDEEKDEFINQELEIAKRDYAEAGVEFNASEIRSDIESKMILTKKDSTGIYQPIPTDKQIEAAREIVGTEIEMQTGHKETKTGGRAPRVSGGSGSGGGGGSDDGSGYATYDSMIDAWDRGDVDAMGSLNPDYEYKLDRNTWEWTVKEPDTQKMVDGELSVVPGRVVTRTRTPRKLANFIFKYGVKEGQSALDKYDREAAAFKSRYGTQHSKWRQEKDGKKTGSGYTEADIKATMDANPEATREQVIAAFENQQ